MSRVYSQSFLTIAATLASDDNQGFLGAREDHIAREYQLSINGEVSRFYVRQKILHDDSDLLDRNPLLTRAWAFQELLVSARIVCFAQSEIMWHCLQVSNCECDQWHRSSPALLASKLQEQRKSLPIPSWKSETTRWSAASLEYRRWYEIIEAYTQLKLTHASDRLPALAALSQRFQGSSKSDYAAGLWKGDILRGLLWEVSWEVPGIGTKPLGYRAPSWSWASVDAKVIYDRAPADSAYAGRNWEQTAKYDDSVFKISKVSCHPRGLNPYGEVEAGFLSVMGGLATANLEIPEIKSGGDETRARYVLWPRGKDKPVYSTRWPPLNHRGCFRPDVPLMPVSYKSDLYPESFITAERSDLKPGSARSAFSCQVFVLSICTGVMLVLAPSQRQVSSYERLGLIIMDDDMIRLWYGMGTLTDLRIV